jgi:4-hydroxy-tetrahydrodipicolinate synthase
MTAQLRGVLTALATPFATDGNVDEALLRALVDRSIAGGVHGVVACGSTGEFSTLSGDERRLVVETVVDQVAGRIPVIAQTGATSTAEAIRLSRHAQAAGADVVMTVAPYYEPLSIDETLSYLRAVAGSVDIPVMLYNLPVAAGVDLDPDTVGALARETENIRYIKNTTVDMAQSAVSAGNLAQARETWARVYPLIDAIMAQPFIPAVKAGLAAAGFPVGKPREPVAAIDPAAATRIAELAAARTQFPRPGPKAHAHA